MDAATRPGPAFLDPTTLPERYALRVAGDCMSPGLCDGDFVIGEGSRPVSVGDLVIIFTGHGPSIKRLVTMPPPDMEFPYAEHPDSEVSPIVILEQENPRRQLMIKCSSILALHRAEPTAPDNVTGR